MSVERSIHFIAIFQLCNVGTFVLIQLELLFVRYGQVPGLFTGYGTALLGFRRDGSLYAEQGNFEEACKVARSPGVYAVQCGETCIQGRGTSLSCSNSGVTGFSDPVGNKTGRVVIVCGVFYD